MKKYLISLAIIGLVAASYAADKVADGSGVVRNMTSARWTVTKCGNETTWGVANTSTATTITNIINTTSAVIGKIVYVPGALTDSFAVYNAATGATCTGDLKVFEGKPNSPTMANSTTFQTTLGQPIVYDLTTGGGWPCVTGVTVLTTRPSTATASTIYISTDKAR